MKLVLLIRNIKRKNIKRKIKMKIEELLRNIENEKNTCRNLEECLGRINSIKINIEFPATE